MYKFNVAIHHFKIQKWNMIKIRNIGHPHEEARNYLQYYKPLLKLFRLFKSVLSVLFPVHRLLPVHITGENNLLTNPSNIKKRPDLSGRFYFSNRILY